MAKIMARILISKDFEGLTPAQRAAIVEAISMTVVQSGHTSDAQRRYLRLDLLELPWAWEPDDGSPDGLVDRRALQLTRLENEHVIGQVAAMLARELDRRILREQVYRLMVALALADGGMERDFDTLEPVRAAFAIQAGRAWEIREELKDELVAMVA